MPKLIYALQVYYENDEKKTRPVHIDEVENGLKCNCICPNPKCNSLLVAKNEGDTKAHHFAHANGEECKHGYESMLHLLAKDILLKANQITLPKYYFRYANTNRGEYLIEEGDVFHYDSVELEKSIETHNGKFTPDAILWNGRKSLAIEIFVTHKVDEEKANRIKQKQFSTLEIRINPKEEWTLDKLRKVVLEDVAQKTWIHKNGTKELADKLYKSSDIRTFSIDSKNYGEILSCPKKLWRNTQLKTNISSCTLCEYCFGIETPNVYCAFKQACTCRKDFDKQVAERKEEQIEKINKFDEELILCGICPECSNYLRVKFKDDLLSVLCSNFSCKFLMKVEEDRVTYINRYGKKNILPLPDFVKENLRDRKNEMISERYALEQWAEQGLCPSCNGKLVLRYGYHGYFIGCSNYGIIKCKTKFNPNWESKTLLFKKKFGEQELLTLPIPDDIMKEYNDRIKCES